MAEELSLAAAQDEVAHKERAIEGADKQLAKLAKLVSQVKRSKKNLERELAAARRELAAAEKRDVQAAAGAAEARGSA